MTTACATTEIYWGIGGEYGPFHVQQEGPWAGWPDFGEVLRHFRKKAKLSPTEFREIYAKATEDGSLSERQLRRMENQNQVPPDMNKRKTIANLLNIPPWLLGLASLEDVTLYPHQTGASLITRQTTFMRVTVDISKYQNNIKMFWILHDTSEASSRMSQILTDINELEGLESQARGDLLYKIRELLVSYHILNAHVFRDQREFALSHHHANQAVRIGRAENDSDWIATSLSTRGCTYLEWGMFGTLSQRVFQIQEDKISKAIQDFERALHKGGLHPQLLGFIRIHLSRAYALTKFIHGEKTPALAITMLDNTADNIGKENIDDPYQRVLATGFGQPLTMQGLHTARASTFNAEGMAGKALQEIRAIEALQMSTIGKDITRHWAWLDIVAANSFIGLRQFDEATRRAKRALTTSRDIKSLTSLTNLVNIHGLLIKSSYKDNTNVRELGEVLRDSLTSRLEQSQEQEEKDY